MDSRPAIDRRLEIRAGWLSIAAGGIHGLVTPAHFAEWWGYGLFFVAAASAQLLFGLALLTRAIGPAGFGTRWRTWVRRLYIAGIAGNILIIGMYIVSRTVGVPAGPEAGEREPVAFLDVLSKIVELALILVLALLLRKGAPREADLTINVK